jgi:E3 ubiquitin-protein ligase DOA10
MNADTEDQEKKCRFCWMAGASPENPLLGTCKCAGSVGYIHLDCLKEWLNVKKQQKNSTNFSTFFWKAFECEICKSAYPLMIKAQNDEG